MKSKTRFLLIQTMSFVICCTRGSVRVVRWKGAPTNTCCGKTKVRRHVWKLRRAINNTLFAKAGIRRTLEGGCCAAVTRPFLYRIFPSTCSDMPDLWIYGKKKIKKGKAKQRVKREMKQSPGAVHRVACLSAFFFLLLLLEPKTPLNVQKERVGKCSRKRLGSMWVK